MEKYQCATCGEWHEDWPAYAFSWLANHMPDYDNDDIKLTVVTNQESERPAVFPHQSQDHPLVHDFYQGISFAEAERRIIKMLGK